MKEEYILFNKMNTGSYDNENIGHEIINYFKADNGYEYIYILPYGGIGYHQTDKIKHILLTGSLSNGRIEIIAKIPNLNPENQVFKNGNGHYLTNHKNEKMNINSHNKNKKNHEIQIKEIDKESVFYHDLPIYKIMEDNYGAEEAIYYSFKCKDNIFKPKRPLFITNIKEDEDIKNNIYYINNNVQRSKGYLSNSSNSSDYKKIVNIINDEALWEKKDNTPTVDEFLEDYLKDMNKENNNESNFINIIKKHYDELAFSNMFEYFIKRDDKVLKNLVSFLVNSKVNKSEVEKALITREENNIDLIIRTQNHFIVIENKIKSSINGIKKESDKISETQLDKYYRYAEFLTGDNKALNKNDNFIRKYTTDLNKKTSYFIFTPNYNNINLSKYDKHNIYQVIKYSTLHKFFKENRPTNFINKKEEYYYDDFINALEFHSQEKDSYIYKKIQDRFIDAINLKTKYLI